MPSFNYTKDIPDGPHNPSNDQGPMKTNTNSISDIINVDHYTFGTSSRDGWHRQCTFPVQTAPTTVAGQVAIYAKTGAISSELFMIRDGNAGTEVALTTSKIGAPSATANGCSWLPGGILIQWGSISGAPIANGAAVTFVTTFPNATFSVTITGTSNSTSDKTINITTGSVSTSGFTVITSGTSAFQKLYWMAIGN